MIFLCSNSIWSRALTTEDVQQMTNCNRSGSSRLPGDIANMELDAQWHLTGYVVDGNVPFQEICLRDK